MNLHNERDTSCSAVRCFLIINSCLSCIPCCKDSLQTRSSLLFAADACYRQRMHLHTKTYPRRTLFQGQELLWMVVSDKSENLSCYAHVCLALMKTYLQLMTINPLGAVRMFHMYTWSKMLRRMRSRKGSGGFRKRGSRLIRWLVVLIRLHSLFNYSLR